MRQRDACWVGEPAPCETDRQTDTESQQNLNNWACAVFNTKGQNN